MSQKEGIQSQSTQERFKNTVGGRIQTFKRQSLIIGLFILNC